MSISTRFELEQRIMHCWNVTDDINMLVRRNASLDDFSALSKLYQHKFEDLFQCFEDLLAQRQLP